MPLNIKKLLRILFNTNVYLSVLSTVVAVAGDYSVYFSKSAILKALCDNLTHALIGGLSWSISYLNRNRFEAEASNGISEIFLCTILSSVIDIDHFLAAKSLLLKDATKLRQRPPLHCSTVPLAAFLLLFSLSYIFGNVSLKRFALILLTAFSTHHIRDGTRRGLWFYPFGSTPPISYLFYILLIGFVPLFIILLERIFLINNASKLNGFIEFA